jgi:hypothetical protein
MKYKSVSEELGLRFLAMFFPLWGVVAPAALILFMVLLLRLPAHISLVSSLGIILTLLAFIVLCAYCSIVLDDDQISINKNGLSFPLKFWPTLRHKSQFKWSELSSLKLNWQRRDKFEEDESILLGFSNGGHARLKLSLLDQKQLEQFFIAFEACAFKCERDAELADFEEAIQASQRELGHKTCSELWDQTLAQRFSPATFTPLEPEATLQDRRYTILRQLSFGGFAAVYLARPVAGGFVIIKESCLPQNDDVQSKANQFFEREASLLAKLDHPNIVKILDRFAEGGRQYIVLEQIRGIDLGRYVREAGPQDEKVVLNFAGQIVEALRYLHSQSPPIVHRDITPDNLLLRPDGKVMLIDFGAAKEIIGSFTGTIIGKQAFMAPEQFKGNAAPASDIYSVGATLFYLASGKQPEPLATSNLNMPEAIAISSNETATAINDDRHRLKSIIEKCTALSPDLRPDAVELQKLLDQKTALTDHKSEIEVAQA